MKKININLTIEEFEYINSLYPKGGKSSTIGKRAVEIVKIHFLNKYPDCKFRDPKDGCDLEVLPQNIKLEIKGTNDAGIAWNKLKVSSIHSYNQLMNNIPVYRVTNVFAQNPVMFILIFNLDFTMVQEDRWSIKRQ